MTNTPPKLKLAQTAEEIAAATASVEAAIPAADPRRDLP